MTILIVVYKYLTCVKQKLGPTSPYEQLVLLYSSSDYLKLKLPQYSLYILGQFGRCIRCRGDFLGGGGLFLGGGGY